MYLKMVGEDLHAKGAVPGHLTTIPKVSRSKRVRQQERLTPEDILLKVQPTEKVVIRQKSRQLGGNSERVRTSEIKKLKRSLLGPGLTKRRKCEVELKHVCAEATSRNSFISGSCIG